MGITGASAGSVTVNVTVTTVAEQVVPYVAGEAIAAKAPVCVGESDAKVYLAKADSSTTMPAIGIAQAAAAIDETVYVYQTGKVTSVLRDADFDYDDLVFVSPLNAGKLTNVPPETVGHFVQSMGRAINASDISLQVDQTFLEVG